MERNIKPEEVRSMSTATSKSRFAICDKIWEKTQNEVLELAIPC